jgi:pimeloyl-ACP methyl ester carboxylesterase
MQVLRDIETGVSKEVNIMRRTIFLCWLIVVLTAGFVSAQAPKSNWAKFDGNKIHYYDIGNAKNKSALIFVHGWTCNADFWKDSYNAFPGYRVIAVDLIGHGQSDKPKAVYSMEYFAKSVEAVMKKAKVQKAVLVGHSMGTPVARQFYRLYPDMVLGIVIVDGSLVPFFSNEQAEQLSAAFRKDFKGTTTQFVNGMIQTIESDAIKKQITDAMLTAPEHVGTSAMEGMMDKRIWANDPIKVPVLAIMAQSPWVKADTKQVFKTIAPNLDFQLWSGVSHFLMMEKPKEFNEQVRTFIATNKLL